MQSLSKVPATQTRGGALYKRRWLHGTLARKASIRMPAISPVMKEGTIARWKKMEGEAFVAGDVLLQIELDFYAADVEAESAGILGKILLPDGTTNVPVEQVIALVAQDASELAQLQSGQSLSSPSPLILNALRSGYTDTMGTTSDGSLSPAHFQLDRSSPRTPTMKFPTPRLDTKASWAARLRPPELDPVSSGTDSLPSPSRYPAPASMAIPSPFRMQLQENVATTPMPGTPLTARWPLSAIWRMASVSREEQAGTQVDGRAIRRMIVSNLASKQSKPSSDLNDFV